jgi:hypothetical protein
VNDSDYIHIPVDEAEVDAIAKARTAAHKGQKSGEFYCKADDAQHRGVAGEMALAEWLGLPMDREIKPGGDGGRDFHVRINDRWVSLDVKCARLPFNLPVKVKDIERTADILVLAGHVPGLVTLYGWDTRDVVSWMKPHTLGDGTVLNFCRRRDVLRPMWQLLDILAQRAA